MASFIRVSQKAYISSKYSKCISAIKRMLYTTAKYTSSSSFVYLCIFLFTAMHVKSLAFCLLGMYVFGLNLLKNVLLFYKLYFLCWSTCTE